MKTGKHRRLWRVGLPVALAAAEATVLVVMYLGQSTGIPAIRNAKTPSAEGRKLRFTYDADVKKNHLQWKWPPVSTEWTEEYGLPMEQLPRSTVEHIQALIEERFLSDPNRWDERFEGVNVGNFNQRCGAGVLIHALWDRSGAIRNSVASTFLVGIASPGPAIVAVFLAGSDGTILYEWGFRDDAEKRGIDPGDIEVEAWESSDGWHMVIHDRTLRAVDANGEITENPKIEYLYRPGDKKLIEIRKLPP